MPRIFKVVINNVRTNNSWLHITPPGWDKDKVEVIADEFDGDRGAVLARETNYSHRIVVISNEDAEAFSRLPGVEEIDEATAVELGDAWRPASRVMVDYKPILDIIDKLDTKDLTQQEKDALDPNSPEPGIRLGESFTDKLTWAKTKKTK